MDFHLQQNMETSFHGVLESVKLVRVKCWRMKIYANKSSLENERTKIMRSLRVKITTQIMAETA